MVYSVQSIASSTSDDWLNATRTENPKKAETLTNTETLAETLARTETLAETLAKTETLAETLAKIETLAETLTQTEIPQTIERQSLGKVALTRVTLTVIP